MVFQYCVACNTAKSIASNIEKLTRQTVKSVACNTEREVGKKWI